MRRFLIKSVLINVTLQPILGPLGPVKLLYTLTESQKQLAVIHLYTLPNPFSGLQGFPMELTPELYLVVSSEFLKSVHDNP